MAWPKGMPRRGHVNKNGTTHAKWGSKVRTPVSQGTVTSKSAGITIRKVSADLLDAPSVKEPRGQAWTAHLSHPTWSIEKCPKCGFPEAEGGFCPNCHWTAPIKTGRVS